MAWPFVSLCWPVLCLAYALGRYAVHAARIYLFACANAAPLSAHLVPYHADGVAWWKEEEPRAGMGSNMVGTLYA